MFAIPAKIPFFLYKIPRTIAPITIVTKITIPAIVRLSVVIENVNDIIADLKQALEAAKTE